MNTNTLSEVVTPIVRKLTRREDISAQEIEAAFDVLFEQDTEGYFWLALTLAMRVKGETPDELYGLCTSIQKLFDERVDFPNAIDLSGSGGKSFKTFNVGTTTAFVVAACGLPVAKQGSTAVTGFTGSTDIAANLGISIKHSEKPALVRNLLEQIGVVVYHNFLHSGKQNTRPRYLSRVRELGLTFVSPFHFAGNIASATKMNYRIYGCFSPEYQSILVGLLQRLGYKRGAVVTGLDGLDEVSTIGVTQVTEFTGDQVREYRLMPEDFGLQKCNVTDLVSSDGEHNMVTFLRVLAGFEKGPKRDLVLANSAMCLYIGEKIGSLVDGVEQATNAIERGAAWEKLQMLVQETGDVTELNAWMAKAGIDR